MPTSSVVVFAALDELVHPQILLALSKVITAISDVVAFAQAQDTMSRIGHFILFAFAYAIYKLITHEWVPKIEVEQTKEEKAGVPGKRWKPGTPFPKDMIPCYDPGTLDMLGPDMPADNAEHVRIKIERARIAQKKWAKSSFKQRRLLIKTINRFVLENQDTICKVSARDSGKPLVDAAFGEVQWVLAPVGTPVGGGALDLPSGGFTGQHGAHIEADGDLWLFDNAGYDGPAAEAYAIDAAGGGAARWARRAAADPAHPRRGGHAPLAHVLAAALRRRRRAARSRDPRGRDAQPAPVARGGADARARLRVRHARGGRRDGGRPDGGRLDGEQFRLAQQRGEGTAPVGAAAGLRERGVRARLGGARRLLVLVRVEHRDEHHARADAAPRLGAANRLAVVREHVDEHRDGRLGGGDPLLGGAVVIERGDGQRGRLGGGERDQQPCVLRAPVEDDDGLWGAGEMGHGEPPCVGRVPTGRTHARPLSACQVGSTMTERGGREMKGA